MNNTAIDKMSETNFDINQKEDICEFLDNNSNIPNKYRKKVLFGVKNNKNKINVYTEGKLGLGRSEIRTYIGGIAQYKNYDIEFIALTKSEIENRFNSLNSSKEISIENNDTEIQNKVKNLFNDSIRNKASDIHIYSNPEDPHIDFRINGEIERIATPIDSTTLKQMATSMYLSMSGASQSNKKGYRPEMNQSASIDHRYNGKRYRMRYQDAQVNADEECIHVTLRVIDRDKDLSKVTLESLGYETDQAAMVLDVMLKGKPGMIIFVGSVGDGKSTSAQVCLSHLVKEYHGRKNIYTTEDPVENIIPGVQHQQVQTFGDEEISAAWNRVLTANLRRDGDFIFQGEIRDRLTASRAIETALSGTVLLATLHANSVFEGISRLSELGVPLNIMATRGFIKGMIYQKLLQVVCPNCGFKYSKLSREELIKKGISESLLNRLAYFPKSLLENVIFRNEAGCNHPKCRKGVIGRTACVEMLIPDSAICESLKKGNFEEAKQTWLDSGSNTMLWDEKDSITPDNAFNCTVIGMTALQAALKKMFEGIVSPVEIEEKIDRLNADKLHSDGSLKYDEIDEILGKKTKSNSFNGL